MLGHIVARANCSITYLLTDLLTYPLHVVWHIRLVRPLYLGHSLLLCPMLTQQASVLLPLFVAKLFSACLFFCFLLASKLALFLLAGRCSSCKHDQAMSIFSFQDVTLQYHTQCVTYGGGLKYWESAIQCESINKRFCNSHNFTNYSVCTVFQ